MAAPKPAIAPQPSSPATVGGAVGSTLVHCPLCTKVFSAKAPIPNAGVRTVPSVSVIGCAALWVSKQRCCLPFRQARQCPYTACQLRITKSPGATSVTPSNCGGAILSAALTDHPDCPEVSAVDADAIATKVQQHLAAGADHVRPSMIVPEFTTASTDSKPSDFPISD
jgi:hypothetical protein